MRTRWFISVLALAACASNDDRGAADRARLIAPQSLATVTQQRPTLRWASTSKNVPVVDLCTDRGCTKRLSVPVDLGPDQLSAVPAQPLPTGWMYWRVRYGAGAAETSATWQFWVGAASATKPVDTSSGAVLDVNGDGRPDFLVGSPGQGGRVYLYLGTDHPSAADWNAATSATRIDITSPDPTSLQFGYTVASAGDVNGDGYGDFLVGTRNADQPPGAVRLYLGSAAPSAADWNGASAARRIDLVNPDGPGNAVGSVIGGAGDVNGDGYADFLVASESSVQTAPAVYLHLGSAQPTAAAWSGPASATRIQIKIGASAVAAAGDVNGDGYSDFLIGNATPNGPPSHLYLGGPSAGASDWNGDPTAPLRIDLISPDGLEGNFGAAVASAGDVDGDGYSDFLIGAPEFDDGAGVAHLYFGSAAPMPAQWNGLVPPSRRIDLGVHPGLALLGASVAPAGDVDGDGRGDFLIGEPEADTFGAAHLYLGAGVADPETAWKGTLATARIDLGNPIANNGGFGGSVAGVGDINGDGHIDFVISQFGFAALHLGVAQPSATSWSGVSARRLDLTSPGIEGHQANYGNSVASGN